MNHALTVLEFGSILEALSKHAETALGQAVCRQLKPAFIDKTVWNQLKETREAYDLLTDSSPPSLGDVGDYRDSLTRAQKGASLGGQEIYRCAKALAAMRRMSDFLKGRQDSLESLAGHLAVLPSFPRLEEAIFRALEGDGEVLDAASPELASIRSRKASASHRILETVQTWISGRAREYLSDPIYTIRNGRYVLPVKAEHRTKIKGIVHDTSASGSTVYLEPENVLQLGNRLAELEAAERAEIDRILKDLSNQLGIIAGQACAGIEAAGFIDFAFAKARLAFDFHGTFPDPLPQPGITLEAAIHPLLPAEKAVPLTIEAKTEASVLITGPNTGGKTVAIKNVGLAAMMAQSGLCPKARECRLGPFSGVYADIGDEQSLEQSLSTFSGHIKNVAEALRMARPGCLILLDELGAGTDPAEGAALAKAVLAELHESGCTILASSHFAELKAFAYETPGFRNAAMEFDPKTLAPTYRLLMGAAGASQALRIAERHGIPKPVIERAKEGLDQQAQDIGRLMEELDRSQKLARQAQSEADRRAAQLQESLAKADKDRQQAEEIRQTVRSRIAQELEAALRDVRIESMKLFDDLKGKVSRADIDQAKTSLGELETRARRRVAKKVGGAEPLASSVPQGEFHVGQFVKALNLGQSGTIVEIRDGEAAIQAGVMRIWVKLNQIRAASAPPSARPEPGGRASEMRLKKAMTVSPEFMIRKMRAEDAELALSKYLDDALTAGLTSVRIVHGKGEGILRKLAHEVLRQNPHAASFHLADESEGGYGVTIVTLQ